MLLHEKYVTKKETSTHFQSKDLTQSKTRFMNLYYPVLMDESRGIFDNTGYIRS